MTTPVSGPTTTTPPTIPASRPATPPGSTSGVSGNVSDYLPKPPVTGNVSDYLPQTGGTPAATRDTGTVGASSSTTGAAATKNPGGDLGKDAFLKLLVAQLKYQDPTKPMDNSQFLAQTAQFTTVEKLTDLARVEQNLLTAQLQIGASNLIGKTVGYIDKDGKEQSGLVSAVAFAGGSPTLRVGDTDVALSAVKDVRNPAS